MKITCISIRPISGVTEKKKKGLDIYLPGHGNVLQSFV